LSCDHTDKSCPDEGNGDPLDGCQSEEFEEEADAVGEEAGGGGDERPEVEAGPGLEGREDDDDELEHVVEGEGQKGTHRYEDGEAGVCAGDDACV